jgi:hypothetical protein
MTNSMKNRLFSIICVVTSDTDPRQIAVLSSVLEKIGIKYELLCILDSEIENLDCKRNDLALLPNVISLEVLARDVDDFISVGLENALGDYVLEIPTLQDPEKSVRHLVNSVLENPQILSHQIIPIRRTLIDSILSKIASKALGVRVNTMKLVPRISRRDVTEAWGERLTRNKVVRVMTQLDLFSPEVTRFDSSKEYKSRRFIRISLRTIAYSSAAPLRWVTYISLFGATFNIVVTILVLVVAQTQDVVPGWTTTNLQISFFAFIILTLFGMLSEYIYQNTAATLNQRYYRLTNEQVSQRFKMLQEYNSENPENQDLR